VIVIPRRQNVYWTIENTIKEIQEIIKQIGHFPTQSEICIIKRSGLVNAINRNGGINKLHIDMGYKLLSKPKRYWIDDTIKEELSKIIKTIGHFPKQKELKIIGRTDIQVAIGKNGGINKFRRLLEYSILKNDKGYWTEEIICNKLKDIISIIGHLPTSRELKDLGYSDMLNSGINKYGGINYFAKSLGVHYNKRPNGYWTEDNILKELKTIISTMKHFPSSTELEAIGMNIITHAMCCNGSVNKFREKLGYEPIQKTKGYWTPTKIKEELQSIIYNINHFPSTTELIKLHKSDLLGGIQNHGGINVFRNSFGYTSIQNTKGYWTEDVIVTQLQSILKNIGRFPSQLELKRIDSKLCSAIGENGGLYLYRKKCGFTEPLKKPNGYWTEDNILKELSILIKKTDRFPTQYDIIEECGAGLLTAIQHNGGFIKYRELLGYSIDFCNYMSQLHSYCSKRGRNTERIVNDILIEYCRLNNLLLPIKNVKLFKGNVIEFVCNTNRKIGIDVTNTQTRGCIYHKWTKKQYHKYLDELWIVVFSDVFSEEDYTNWNNESPDNVYIMSIDEFCNELQYNLDENTKHKIDRYKECTFHTKEYLKRTQNINQTDLTNYQ